MTHHPCLCDICLKARDDELRRSREAVAQMLMAQFQKTKPGAGRMALAIAVNIIRRGRELTEEEMMENLATGMNDKPAPHPPLKSAI